MLHSDRHLAAFLILKGIPHWSVRIELVFLHPNWVIRKCCVQRYQLRSIRIQFSAFLGDVDHHLFQVRTVSVYVLFYENTSFRSCSLFSFIFAAPCEHLTEQSILNLRVGVGTTIFHIHITSGAFVSFDLSSNSLDACMLRF